MSFTHAFVVTGIGDLFTISIGYAIINVAMPDQYQRLVYC